MGNPTDTSPKSTDESSALGGCLGATLTILGVLAVCAICVIALMAAFMYSMFGWLPSAPTPPPKLSREEAKLPGTMSLLMQEGGPAGPNDYFYLVAFNPTIQRSRVTKKLSADETFEKFGVPRMTTASARGSGNNHLIELYSTPDGKYHLLLERIPGQGYSGSNYIFKITTDEKELVSTDWGGYAIDSIQRGVYWTQFAPEPPFRIDVHYFDFQLGQESIPIQGAGCAIAGSDGNALYITLGRERAQNEPPGVQLYRHNLQTREVANVERLAGYRIAEAGNISNEWGYLYARMSDIGEGYTAFIDLKTEKIIQQNIPGSVVLKVVSPQ